jgi:site-specific recombinase XerD
MVVPDAAAVRDQVQLPLFEAALHPPDSLPPASVPPSTLNEAIHSYCAYLTVMRRASHTVRSTELDLAALVEQLGDLPLKSIQPGHLAAHVQWLRAHRHNGTASVRRKIASLKGCFRYAQASGWLATDPAQGLIYPPPARAPVVALNAAELDAAVAEASHDPSWHALVLLLADAGLKRDEVLALRASDLSLAPDPAQSRVSVRHTSQSKRLRRRAVPLTPRAHAALARFLTAPLPGERLFSLSVRGVNFVVETVGQRAGIARVRKLTPEILRDTFAVREMQARMAVENARAENGLPERELDRLRREQDRGLLELLGLSRYSDMAARYRLAAAKAVEAEPHRSSAT